jgi:hypothetical protein
METADVRKRIKDTIERAKRHSAERRARNTEASAAYEVFRERAAIPVFQQVAGALKAEGYLFSVHTPADSVRLVSDSSSHDFIDMRLDTTGHRPQVIVSVERMKGRETLSQEHPLKPGAAVEQLTEQDVLDAIADGILRLVDR